MDCSTSIIHYSLEKWMMIHPGHLWFWTPFYALLISHEEWIGALELNLVMSLNINSKYTPSSAQPAWVSMNKLKSGSLSQTWPLAQTLPFSFWESNILWERKHKYFYKKQRWKQVIWNSYMISRICHIHWWITTHPSISMAVPIRTPLLKSWL